MPRLEYGLKTGDLTEEEMVKLFEKALTRAAKATSDLHVAKNRKKLKKYTGPFGRSTPDAEPPDYDHIYNFNSGRRGCHLFIQLYPHMERNGRVKFPQEGITVIVSSHILSEIAQTADYIGIIANGMLGYQGEMPEEGHLEELFMKIAAKHRAA